MPSVTGIWSGASNATGLPALVRLVVLLRALCDGEMLGLSVPTDIVADFSAMSIGLALYSGRDLAPSVLVVSAVVCAVVSVLYKNGGIPLA